MPVVAAVVMVVVAVVVDEVIRASAMEITTLMSFIQNLPNPS